MLAQTANDGENSKNTPAQHNQADSHGYQDAVVSTHAVTSVLPACRVSLCAGRGIPAVGNAGSSYCPGLPSDENRRWGSGLAVRLVACFPCRYLLSPRIRGMFDVKFPEIYFDKFPTYT